MKCSRCGKNKMNELWVYGGDRIEDSRYLCSDCRALFKKDDNNVALLLLLSDDTILDSVNLLIWLNDPLLIN